jgi:S1-C subfamily serine protease
MPEPEPIADFAAFNRFAQSGDVDDRTLSGRARWASLRRKSGALLPGAWAKPVSPDQGPGQPGTAAGSAGVSEAGAGSARPGGVAPAQQAAAEGLWTGTQAFARPAYPEDVADAATAPGELPDNRQRPGKAPNWRRWLGRRRLPGQGGHASTGQDSAGQDSAGQDSAGQDSAGQDSAGPDSAGRDGAGEDSVGRYRREGLPGWLRGRRLALAAGGLALVCTMLGGVIGGYVALGTADNPTTNPNYTLGTVPPALTNRPATSVAGIAARVTPSVVMIKVNGGVGTGSGFIIRGDYIVTDNHVVTLDGELNNAVLRVYFSNGQSAPGELIGRDPYSDIAVIRAVGVSGLPALSLGNSTGVDVGDPVLAVGSPLGLADTVTSGIVSAVNRPVQPGQSGNSPQVYFDAIQTDAAINPGNSGGPLVNAQGQVIGVDAAIDTLGDNPLTGTQGGSIGLGFAIPINQARRVALELIRTGSATHAVIGAQIAAGWGGDGAEIMPAKAGSTSTVTPGGPAASAGLQPGDVIIKFDGQTINDADTLLDAVTSLAPGTRTSVTFTQAGQTLTSTIQLGSAPS